MQLFSSQRLAALLVVGVVLGALGACSSNATSPEDESADTTPTSNVDQPIPDEGGGLQTGLLTFGQSAESQYPGLYVKVAPPQKIGDYSDAAAFSGGTKIGKSANGFTNFTVKVVYQNKGDKPLDIQGEALEALSGASGLSCARAFDTAVPVSLQNGTGVLRAKGTRTYGSAWSCKGKKGADLTITAVVRPSDMRESDEPLTWGGALP